MKASAAAYAVCKLYKLVRAAGSLTTAPSPAARGCLMEMGWSNSHASLFQMQCIGALQAVSALSSLKVSDRQVVGLGPPQDLHQWLVPEAKSETPKPQSWPLVKKLE